MVIFIVVWHLQSLTHSMVYNGEISNDGTEHADKLGLNSIYNYMGCKGYVVSELKLMDSFGMW